MALYLFVSHCSDDNRHHLLYAVGNSKHVVSTRRGTIEFVKAEGRVKANTTLFDVPSPLAVSVYIVGFTNKTN